MRQPVLSFTLALVISMSGTACSAEPRSPVDADVEIEIASAAPAPAAPKERKTAVRIITEGAKCSATKLGPHTLLSASHCFRHAGRVIIVDDKPAIIERIHQDQNDHSLVLLSEITLQDFAILGPPLKEGEYIHYWGNPFVFTMLLRRGYVSGFYEVNTIYDVNGYHGDSGAGVFNAKNRLVGVISYIHGSESFAVMGSYPLNFTAEQLKDMELKPEPLLMTGVKANVNLEYGD